MQPLFDNPEYGPSLKAAGPCYSLVDEDGGVYACSGLAKQWENRASAWALISTEAGKHFYMIHKAVRRGILLHHFRRIEATVDVGFEQGYRWMKLLGFEYEGRMRAYTPDGRDCDLFARVQ